VGKYRAVSIAQVLGETDVRIGGNREGSARRSRPGAPAEGALANAEPGVKRRSAELTGGGQSLRRVRQATERALMPPKQVKAACVSRGADALREGTHDSGEAATRITFAGEPVKQDGNLPFG
jgi:hypothetical protein